MTPNFDRDENYRGGRKQGSTLPQLRNEINIQSSVSQREYSVTHVKGSDEWIQKRKRNETGKQATEGRGGGGS